MNKKNRIDWKGIARRRDRSIVELRAALTAMLKESEGWSHRPGMTPLRDTPAMIQARRALAA